MEENVFRAAMEAIDQKDRARARDLLTRLIKKNPESAEYWLWMSSVVDTARERVFCLKEALKLEPENEIVRRGLILSGELPPDEKLILPDKFQTRAWRSTLDRRPSFDDLGNMFSWKKMLLAGGAFIAVVAFIIFALSNPRQSKQTTMIRPQRTPTASQTAIPVLTLAAKDISSGSPTPLWMFLPATYTPTPLYVNTPHPRSEAYRTALRSMQRGDFQSMLTFLDQSLALQPDEPDLYYYKGEAYRLMGNSTQALKFYQQALALDSSFAPAYVGMARVAASSNRTADAQKYFQKALSLDEDYVEIYLDQAALYLQSLDGEPALAALNMAATAMPDSMLLHFYRARALFLIGEYGTALEEAYHAQKLDITYLPAYPLIGQIALAAGKPEDAVEHLQTYLRYQPDDGQAEVWLGAAFAAQGQTDKAMQAFDQAIQVDKQAAEAYLQRGLLYLADGQAEKAIHDLVTAVGLKKSFTGYIALGKAYWLQGDERSAYVQFANAEGYAKNNLQKAEMYTWRAQSLLKIDEKKAAIRDWKALLALPRENIPLEWITLAEENLNQLITLTPSPPPPTGTNTPRPTLTATITRTRQPSATSASATLFLTAMPLKP
ncbi:MAG: tetratricopeptide repeat protein [Anaerolineaceae bacterium]|nr:tetratricopeptide repeat protein [Anaerolineaceae bacterium]